MREAADAGVTTSTIGFGADYDEGLLRAMAEAGAGHSYYIENPDQAPGAFEEEIEGLLSLAAQNIEVKIEPEPFVDLVNIHNNYPSHGGPDGIAVSLGDLYAREPKSLLVEFFVPGIGELGEREIARIRATADVVNAGGGVERQEIRLPISGALRVREARSRRSNVPVCCWTQRRHATRQENAGDAEISMGRRKRCTVSSWRAWPRPS